MKSRKAFNYWEPYPTATYDWFVYVSFYLNEYGKQCPMQEKEWPCTYLCIYLSLLESWIFQTMNILYFGSEIQIVFCFSMWTSICLDLHCPRGAQSLTQAVFRCLDYIWPAGCWIKLSGSTKLQIEFYQPLHMLHCWCVKKWTDILLTVLCKLAFWS